MEDGDDMRESEGNTDDHGQRESKQEFVKIGNESTGNEYTVDKENTPASAWLRNFMDLFWFNFDVTIICYLFQTFNYLFTDILLDAVCCIV